ncbi:MAG: DUF1697 domain-containing protein [Myxococcota bacterium]|nr:DUF1697 domain-containing protein [Myxococcota bacterium]
MKATLSIFENAGCKNVRNYIQSGNIIFTAPSRLGRRIPALATAGFESAFGLHVPVLVRSRDEMRAIANGNPLRAAGAGPAHLHVFFLADAPAATESPRATRTAPAATGLSSAAARSISPARTDSPARTESLGPS